MGHSTKTFNIWSIFCLAIVLIVNSSTLHAENSSDGRSVIETLNSRWNEAFNSGKPESMTELYDQSAVLSPGNGEVLVGKMAIEGLFRSFIENGVHNHTIEIIDTHFDGNTLYEVSKWNAYGQEENGKKPEFGGILVNIFHADENGEWKSHLHLWNVSN